MGLISGGASTLAQEVQNIKILYVANNKKKGSGSGVTSLFNSNF
jgi:hypothetical protein